MGFSSSSNKPIYGSQLTGAASAMTNTYNQQAPKLSAITDQVTGLTPSLIDRAQHGTPELNAAGNYITTMLGSDPAHNPQLEAMIAQTNSDVGNGVNAKMGVRGLTGGTVHEGVLAKMLAQNETGLRYNDYSQQQQLRAQAAGMAPGLSAAQTGLYAPVFDTAQAATMPMQAANAYGAGIGGLLGQYQKTSNPWGASLAGAIGSAASGWASGGFRGV